MTSAARSSASPSTLAEPHHASCSRVRRSSEPGHRKSKSTMRHSALLGYNGLGARDTRSSFSARRAAKGGRLLFFLPTLEDENPCASAGGMYLLQGEGRVRLVDAVLA